jgi:hypothetical protein
VHKNRFLIQGWSPLQKTIDCQEPVRLEHEEDRNPGKEPSSWSDIPQRCHENHGSQHTAEDPKPRLPIQLLHLGGLESAITDIQFSAAVLGTALRFWTSQSAPPISRLFGPSVPCSICSFGLSYHTILSCLFGIPDCPFWVVYQGRGRRFLQKHSPRKVCLST